MSSGGGDRIGFEQDPSSGGTTPVGPAGGDLGGSYPSPSVVAIQGNAADPTALGAGDAGKAMIWTGTAWKAVLVPGLSPQVYTCPMSAAVGQLVYLSGTDAVDLADASNPAKMPARWFIVSKPNATSCILQDRGELGGFVLTPGAVYYADPATPGGITTTRPTTTGQVAQQVGVAKDTTTLDITISSEPPIYL